MIAPLKKEHTAQVAEIHQSALSSDFLPSLGFSFLKTLYDGIAEKPGIFGFVFMEKNEVEGFVVGARTTNTFFREAIKSHFFKLVFYLGLALIKKPAIITKIFETLFYPSKSDGSSAELVVLAVDKKFRNKGVGSSLIKSLEKEFRKVKIKKYKLTVHADKKAIYFYEKLAYDRKSAFTLYDKKWYVYEKKLS